jgi:hypothetical protein
MVRMKRPVPSKFPGADYDFGFAADTGNTPNAIKATERLRFDLDNYADSPAVMMTASDAGTSVRCSAHYCKEG